MIPRRGRITPALVSFMEAATGRPAEAMQGEQTLLGETFGDTLPYVLVEPMTGGTLTEVWGGYSGAEVPYAFHSYGKDGQQAEWMADRAANAFEDETKPLFIQGYSVEARLPDGLADEPEKVANDLWHVRQAVLLRVQSG